MILLFKEEALRSNASNESKPVPQCLTLSSWKVLSSVIEMMPMLPSEDADARMRPSS